MPSLADVANDLKGLLQSVKTNTASTASRLQDTNNKLDALNGRVDTLTAVDQAGFANLSSGLAVVIARQEEAINLLDINRRQNDTIICWLETIADLLCRQLHRLNTQVELQKLMAEQLVRLTAVTELVHPREFIEVSHRNDLTARIDACCPPEPERPEECYAGCKAPEHRPFDRPPTGWHPLPEPQRPIG